MGSWHEHAGPRPKPPRTYSDRRTTLGKTLARWRADLVADLGGREAVSTQQAAIVDSFTKLDGEHLTKTRGSTQTIDLRPQAAQAIKEQRAASQLKSDFVFCNSVGGLLDRDNLRAETARAYGADSP